jgi:hypothetical protein
MRRHNIQLQNLNSLQVRNIRHISTYTTSMAALSKKIISKWSISRNQFSGLLVHHASMNFILQGEYEED